MKPQHLHCPDDPDEDGYNGSILLSSPAYPLKVETDVRLFLIKPSFNNKWILFIGRYSKRNS